MCNANPTHRWYVWWLQCSFSKSVPVKALEPFVLLYVLDTATSVAESLARIFSASGEVHSYSGVDMQTRGALNSFRKSDVYL